MISKLMIVEDDETMRNLLKLLLELEGFHVTLCDRFDESGIFANIKDTSPDILLMDLRIKNTDGLNILKTLRSDASTKNLKIIMTSGMPEKDRCLKAGANDFILKPFMPDELIGSIHKLAA
jgi:two-component system, NtrC family, C4-dicarboxylate transport response regulator DctD